MRREDSLDFIFLSSERRRHAAIGIFAGAAIILLGLLFFIDPSRSSLYPPCLFHLLTGLYCPGCGSFRSLHEMLHGNFLGAFSYNPLTVLLLPLMLFLACWDLLSGRREKTIRVARIEWISIWLLLVIILVFWFLRNLPSYPFSLLAPG